MKLYRFIILLLFSWFPSIVLSAQPLQQKRQEIDAKRIEVDFSSRDALPRGREFKRIDSTYYVGWLYEGAYRFDHAADFLGFKTAGTQLERAVRLMEKDFRTQLSTRTSDVIEFIQHVRIHRDWDYAVYCLMNCYSNTEDMTKLWQLLQKCRKMDLQDEQYLDTYHYLAWTVHRNRYYTSEKYPFLKNSIDENEKLANSYLDTAAMKVKRDALLNKAFMAVDYEGLKMPGVWHYKAMLFGYQLNIPSGGYYYEKLRPTVYFPHNNYATFCAIQGKFAEATREYNIAKLEDAGDKRMKESYYYLSIMNAYRAHAKEGIMEMKDLIRANGSTPGYGWYNMALARDLIYDGQLDLADQYLKNAKEFKEIHIGTTLGQSHYDFSTTLLQIIILQKKIDEIKYLNKGWWYSPVSLTQIGKLTAEKYSLQFLIINQFASNPERDRVIYKIFSTESTVSFDEIWQLIDGFSTNYFLEKFKKDATNDKRPLVKKYYQYFVARLLMKKENYAEAKTYLLSVIGDKNTDRDFEKLFLTRVYEALYLCDQKLTNESNKEALQYILTVYPQLIPYSGMTVPATLTTNAASPVQKEIIASLKQSELQWNSGTTRSLNIVANFSKKGNLEILSLSSSFGNQSILPITTLSCNINQLEELKKKIPLYIFGCGNDQKHVNMPDNKK